MSDRWRKERGREGREAETSVIWEVRIKGTVLVIIQTNKLLTPKYRGTYLIE